MNKARRVVGLGAGYTVRETRWEKRLGYKDEGNGGMGLLRGKGEEGIGSKYVKGKMNAGDNEEKEEEVDLAKEKREKK